MVIKHLVEGSECQLNIGEIEYPTCHLINSSGDVNLDSERMPVESGALVAFGHIGESVGRLKDEFLEYFHTNESYKITVISNNYGAS